MKRTILIFVWIGYFDYGNRYLDVFRYLLSENLELAIVNTGQETPEVWVLLANRGSLYGRRRLVIKISFTKDAPEYKEYKLKEGEFDEAHQWHEENNCSFSKEYKLKEGELDETKHLWHEENNTYGFSHGLGILIMGIGILTFLGIFSPKTGLVGAGLAIVMTLGTLSFLVTTPEVWVPDLGSGEQGFPLLTGAGRLVIKDIAILAGAVVVLSDSAGRVLNQLKK